MKKTLTVIGARPQFIRASVVSKAILEAEGLNEATIYTDQNFDTNISGIGKVLPRHMH